MPAALILADLAVMLLCWSAAVRLRLFLGGEFAPGDYAELLPSILIHILLNATLGSYNPMLSPPMELKKCTLGTLLFVLIFTAATFWMRTHYAYSRGILLIGGFFLLLAVPIGRMTTRAWCSRFPWWGYRTVFYVYKDFDPQRLGDVFRNLSSGLRPCLVIFHTPGLQPCASHASPTVDGPGWLDSPRHRPGAAFVFLAHGDFGPEISAILAKAEKIFGRIIILHESLSMGNLWARTVDMGNMLGLEAVQRLLDPKRLLLKTATDLLVSAVLVLLLMPVFIFIALCIWVESPGAVLFRHRRVGRGGREFFAYKFRTMHPNSEGVLKTALARDDDVRRQWEEHRKLANDPRITRVGRLLRRSSLDELPQLFNVLRGEMSLIGPRPIMAEEIALYGDCFGFVNQVRPGLTGLWQVSGRSRLSYRERVEHDVYYIKNWSLWLDMYILLKTPAAVLDFSGAA